MSEIPSEYCVHAYDTRRVDWLLRESTWNDPFPLEEVILWIGAPQRPTPIPSAESREAAAKALVQSGSAPFPRPWPEKVSEVIEQLTSASSMEDRLLLEREGLIILDIRTTRRLWRAQIMAALPHVPAEERMRLVADELWKLDIERMYSSSSWMVALEEWFEAQE